MMASHGLTTIDGSGSGGREPGRSSRVKQSCRLLKLVFRASVRSRSENSRQSAIERSRMSGCSILLNHPMNRVSAARGMRLVRRKLRSSCCDRAEMTLRTVMILSAGLVSAWRHGLALSDSVCRDDGVRRRGYAAEIGSAAAVVAGQTSLADRAFEDVAQDRAPDPVL